MPRRGPDQVIERRMTLGTYERNLLEPVLKAQATRDNVRTASLVGVGLIATAGVVGASWLAFEAFMLSRGLLSEYENTKEKIKTGIEAATVGLPSYKASNPDPASTLFRDPDDPTRRINPAAGVPVVGALFGLGMVIGEKTNPFPDSTSDAIRQQAAAQSPSGEETSWWQRLGFGAGGAGVF